MELEHFALNVSDPVNIASWYVSHLDLFILRQQGEPSYTTLLSGNRGRMMIEIYNDPDTPERSRLQDPPVFRLAFTSDQPKEDKIRLQKAGAREISDDITDDGDHVIMLRDPWGITIQVSKRR